MTIAKERGEQMRELADIAASKLDLLSNREVVCHATSSWLLPDIAREGIIAERFAERMHKKEEAYRSTYHAPQNHEYVSVTYAWDKIFAGHGGILLFIKTTKPILDPLDTEYTRMLGWEFLIKRRVSPKEFVGICWYGRHRESFRNIFDQVVEDIWTKKPELAVPIYQTDSRSNPSNLLICPGLSWLQNMKILWPTKEPGWLNWH